MNEKTPENASASVPPIVIQAPPPPRSRRWIVRLLLMALMFSIFLNFAMMASHQEYLGGTSKSQERFHSGDKTAVDKIALIEIESTIMPPFTERILDTIKQAGDDDDVKGVVLVVDSPGGLVSDSHRIYHRLQELRQTKPVYVSMKRMAASGGYYVAMGAGPEGHIFAEPTTWTGSIGVIIPHYDATQLSEKVGITSKPLKTGEFKDSLSPFRELSEREQEVWGAILDEAYGQFQGVIVENRANLNAQQVRELATGQIFTAQQAKQNGLIDRIGYDDDAIQALQDHLNLGEARVVRYEYQPNIVDLLTGTVQARQPENAWRRLLDATVPRCMYFCSWAPGAF